MLRTFRSLVCATSALAFAATALAQEPLTLYAAWARVLAASPDMAVLAEEREAVAGEAEQAGRSLNPELSAELENVFGTGSLQGVKGADLTVQLSQTFLRREKREARRRHAESVLPVAEAELAVKLADLRQRTSSAFTAVLIAQESLKLRREAVDLASRTVATLLRQREAGQASGIDLARAKVGHASAQVALESATTVVDLARRALVAQWGGGQADFPSVVGRLEVDALPDLAMLEAMIENASELQVIAAEARRRETAVDFEKSVGTRDVTVGGGLRFLREGTDAAFVVGVSVPLLTNDRNQGAVRAAKARLRQSPLQAASVRLSLRAELASYYAVHAAARREAILIAGEVLPAAEELVQQNEAALSEGRASFLQVLEAQQMLLENRERRLDAIDRFLQSRIAIERLTGALELPPATTS